MYSPLGIVFVGNGIAEVDQKAIAQILGDISLKMADDLSAGFLIVPYYLAQLLRVELCGEGGRTYQIAKHHRQLTPLS
jgi:hypothetical protein